MNGKVAAIIQARMGSIRLPEKMMLDLHGYPVVEWVSRRVSVAEKLDCIIFALPDSEGDDELARYLSGIGATVFRGSENDVLNRFYEAAIYYDVETIVRICADNPFVSASEIDHLVTFFNEHIENYDYAYNHIPRNNLYPDGIGAEITSFRVLETLHNSAEKEEHREHIFNYIWDNQDLFSIGTFNPENRLIAHPELKLDLDTVEDYKKLLRLNVNPNMTAQEIIEKVLKANN